MHSLHQLILWALNIVQTIEKEDDTEVNGIGGPIKPNGIVTVVLDLEYDTGQIQNLTFKKSTSSPERPSSSSAIRNGPRTEEKTYSEGKGPT